jgi:hypothetical protein
MRSKRHADDAEIIGTEFIRLVHAPFLKPIPALILSFPVISLFLIGLLSIFF